MSLDALIDSNVLIAALNPEHQHHEPSAAVVAAEPRYVISVHSLSETYSCLTRAPWNRRPDEAMAAISALVGRNALRGLSATEHYDALRRFAARGLAGPLLYDALIGEVARLHGIPIIITWNLRHMTGLFPELDVMTPAQFLHRA